MANYKIFRRKVSSFYDPTFYTRILNNYFIMIWGI